MIKRICIAVCIMAVHEISAMDTQIVDAKSIAPIQNPDIFPLMRLPPEIQNCIAQFLPFKDYETDEAFIERTRVPKTVPSKHYQHFLMHSKPEKEPSDPYAGYGYCAYYCPDQTKIALLEIPEYIRTNPSKPTITIIDVKKNKKIWRGKGRYGLILIALSQHADMFAYIRRHTGTCKDNATEEEALQWDLEKVLVIKNIVTKKIQKCIIPYTYFVIRSLGFNKQGTHIAVHGLDATQLSAKEHASDYTEIPSKHNLIFPLTSCVRHKNTEPLIEYFRWRGVCKDMQSNDQQKIIEEACKQDALYLHQYHFEMMIARHTTNIAHSDLCSIALVNKKMHSIVCNGAKQRRNALQLYVDKDPDALPEAERYVAWHKYGSACAYIHDTNEEWWWDSWAQLYCLQLTDTHIPVCFACPITKTGGPYPRLCPPKSSKRYTEALHTGCLKYRCADDNSTKIVAPFFNNAGDACTYSYSITKDSDVWEHTIHVNGECTKQVCRFAYNGKRYPLQWLTFTQFFVPCIHATQIIQCENGANVKIYNIDGIHIDGAPLSAHKIIQNIIDERSHVAQKAPNICSNFEFSPKQ